MSIDIEERELATNYMMGVVNAPEFNNPEATAMRMAFTILSDRLFNEIRTQRNLSYAPAASFQRNHYNNPTAMIYVTSTDPTQCAQVMIDELNKLRNEGFTEKELKDQKETFLTSYFMNLETNNSQNNMLGSYNVMSHWSNSMKYMQDVKKLSVADLNAVFKKYVTNVHWVYLGDKSKVDEKVFLQPLK
jgi:predicted Zn-dependent peptidase